MTKVLSNTRISIIGGARPPKAMQMLVSIEAENLPGLAIEATVEVKVLWHSADCYWDSPEVSWIEAHITRCGERVAVTVPTKGQLAEFEREVENFFEKVGYDEIMVSGNVQEAA